MAFTDFDFSDVGVVGLLRLAARTYAVSGGGGGSLKKIYSGSTQIQSIYHGSTAITEVYVGSEKVFG